MSSTKNVKRIEMRKELFNGICKSQYKKNILKIKEIFTDLKEKANSETAYNIPVKLPDNDEIFYLNRVYKILFPNIEQLKKNGHYDNVSNTAFNYYEEEVCWFNDLDPETKLLVIDWYEKNDYALPLSFDNEIAGLSAVPPTSGDLSVMFYDQQENKYYTNPSDYFIMADGRIYRPNGGGLYMNYQHDSYRISIHKFNRDDSLFDIYVRSGIYPVENFECYSDYCKINNAGFNPRSIPSIEEYIKKNNISYLMGIPVSITSIKEKLLENEICLSDDDDINALAIKDYLNNCDYYRAKIQPYNSRWYLSDESRGHWELWEISDENQKNNDTDSGIYEEADKHDNNTVTLGFKEGVIARNPVSDVKHDAVVGIDFGTKSTIVAVQNENEDIVPIRVGIADYSLEPNLKHYENPTVMQFVNLESFIKDYSENYGRPYTSWEDIKISHHAFTNMINSDKSNQYLSFVYDLKQWAAGIYNDNTGSGGKLIIKDEKGNRVDLNRYLELEENDIDPIEIYAYYLGLFINNMHTGIYLDYILSFPETYSIEVKNAVINSFSRGIKKSIPDIIFKDEICCNEYRVRQGQSEPVAYAACALDSYGIEATPDGIIYSIFDFGGGTTDFDYGLWKSAPDDELTYDNLIQHCGSSGDKTLGGENILQLMAYNIFIDSKNQSRMRDKKLVFYRPANAKILPGLEALLNDDECAMLNIKQLMEVIRPIWEENESIIKWRTEKNDLKIEYDSNSFLSFKSDETIEAVVNLFAESGNERIPVTLSVDLEMLEIMIYERIETGVASFFEGLKNTYDKNEWHSDQPIHIFLAGNSSKSSRVMGLFKKYMEKYEKIIFNVKTDEREPRNSSITKVISSKGINDSFDLPEKEDKQLLTKNFILYPPLGTDEARLIQKENGIDIEESSLLNPTGKTGVAFGLVMCREGAGIRVESEIGKNEQIKTNYYIGINYRKKFRMVFDRTNEYGKWRKFNKVLPGSETFEFYYTQLPEVVTNSDIELKGNTAIKKRKCLIDKVEDGAYIYFKFISPNQLEYVVAMEDKISLDEFISSVYNVTL